MISYASTSISAFMHAFACVYACFAYIFYLSYLQGLFFPSQVKLHTGYLQNMICLHCQLPEKMSQEIHTSKSCQFSLIRNKIRQINDQSFYVPAIQPFGFKFYPASVLLSVFVTDFSALQEEMYLVFHIHCHHMSTSCLPGQGHHCFSCFVLYKKELSQVTSVKAHEMCGIIFTIEVFAIV